MDDQRSKAFALLKTFCVQVTKEHTRENIAKLFAALQTVDVPLLQDLQEYVIFPLRLILKHPKKYSQDLYLDLYTCMEYVLGHSKVTAWNLFHDIFSIAISLLSCPTDPSKVAKLSEELKIAIIQTIRTLVKNSEFCVLQHLYTVTCLPLLGHSVSLLLNIAETESSRNLRMIAMECLLDISQADSKCSQCMKADIGFIFASFLPGVSVTMCAIITGDTKQGHAVTAKAIYVWMRIVSLVMDDKMLEVFRQKQSNKSQNNSKSIDERLQCLVVNRDSKWIATTGGNLSILVRQVASVRSHCNWRVRLGLVECAEHLLLHCSSSMKDCVPAFLEILVSLVGDGYSKVSSGSRRALDLFSQCQASDQQHHLTEILEENLHKLATSLPRRIQTADDDEKLSMLNLLMGYISILGSRVKNLLLSLPHLKRLSLALMQALELECTDIKIVEERTAVPGHGCFTLLDPISSCNIVKPRRYFKHFTNERIFQKLQGVCHLLGYYGDINLLIDHFLDIFHDSSMFKMQATLVINELMLGTTGDTVPESNSTVNGGKWHTHSQDELHNVIKMLIDEYLSPTNFDLVTSANIGKDGIQSLGQQITRLTSSNNSPEKMSAAMKLNRNINQISLYLEGFGNFAKVLRINFEPFLMTLIYPLLEKLGDDTAYISNTAFVALYDCCTACNYKSLDNLIRGNADYLMNAISLRLRHLDRNRKCPLVLKVMLQYSSAELLPIIDNTVHEILDYLDDNYAEESVQFMGVLNELAKAVVRWFPENNCTNNYKNTTEIDKIGTTMATTPKSCDNKSSAQFQSVSKTSQPDGSYAAEESCLNKLESTDEFIKKTQNVNTGSINIAADVSTLKDNVNTGSNSSIVSNPFHNHYAFETDSTADNVKSSSNKELEQSMCNVLLKSTISSSEMAKTLTEYFSNLLKLERDSEGEILDEDLENFRPDVGETNDTAEIENEWQKVSPRHVLVVKEIMLRCKHIIASRNPRLRLLVLDTIQHVCIALRPHQNELLPLIHQVWTPFSLCFADAEKLVTIKALEVLQTVSKTAGDFMKLRITKDVLPKLLSFLQSQAEISVHAGPAYQFTVNFKLQLAILTNIAIIAKQSCVSGSSLDLIITACVAYLHNKQPAALQHACLECCKQLLEIDANLMWLKLCSLYCPKPYIPPDHRFIEIKALTKTSSKNAYTGNVLKVLEVSGML